MKVGQNQPTCARDLMSPLSAAGLIAEMCLQSSISWKTEARKSRRDERESRRWKIHSPLFEGKEREKCGCWKTSVKWLFVHRAGPLRGAGRRTTPIDSCADTLAPVHTCSIAEHIHTYRHTSTITYDGSCQGLRHRPGMRFCCLQRSHDRVLFSVGTRTNWHICKV